MRQTLGATVLTAVIGLAALAATPPAAAGPAPTPQETAATAPSAEPNVDGLQQELAGMRRSLDDIALLLAATLDQQQVAVLMTRMELKQRRMAPLEQLLQRTRDDRDGLRQERERMADMREIIREQAGDSEEEAEAMRSDMEHARRALERMDDRLATLDQRVIELEDDLARNLDDIAILEEMVDERLELR